MTKPFLALHAAAVCALALAGCSKSETAPDATASGTATAVAPSDTSVADALDDADGLQVTAEALKQTGLAGIFSGKASYTLLAPTDDAFAKLGDKGKTLTDGANTAALAALLKAHILPGYLTAADIRTAVDKSSGRTMKMRTMAGQEVTFAKDGDALVVSTADGASARMSGDPVAGKGSIALPVDTVLKTF